VRHIYRNDVLVLGGAGVDTIVYVPELPLPYADSYMVQRIDPHPGQTGDNVALGLHALGLRTHHMDILGDDHEGDLIRELHRAAGVPLTAVPTAAGTKRAVNLVGPDGRRLSLYDITRGGEHDRFPAGALAALAAESRHAHVSITHPGQHALPVLASTGVSISTDLHNWDGVNPWHEAFADAADVVFCSATALPDPAAALHRIMSSGRAQVATATMGADGALVLAKGEPEPVHVPAVAPPVPVIDSNGAGDAFVSGFLYGWLRGADAVTSARFGAIAGAHACTVPCTGNDPIGEATLLARYAELPPS
jgi:sugar/nucleoside kinase (ribokinase family)